MLTFKCIKKVQDYLSLTQADLADTHDQIDTLLGAWYVNQLTIDRRKVFLFMNEKTLLSFITIGARKTKSLKHDLPSIFMQQFFQLMKLMGLPLEKSSLIMDEYFQAGFRKTDSRILLGNMNDLAHLYEHMIYHHGGLSHCNLSEIIYSINKTPQRNLGWKYSTDIAEEILANPYSVM